MIKKHKKTIKNFILINKVVKYNCGIWNNKDSYNSCDFICVLTCKKGHQFEILARTLQKGHSWCKNCSSSINYGESLCRIILESLLGQEFRTTRKIKELRSPITGYPLEIDGFNEKTKIGFEYQGNQHLKFIKHIHKNKIDYNKTIIHDNFKKLFFKQKGWKLIAIKQFKTFDVKDNIEYVKNILRENNIKFLNKINIEKVVLNRVNKLNYFQKYEKKCMNYIKKTKVSYLSGSFTSKKNMIYLKKGKTIFKHSVETLLNQKCLTKGDIVLEKGFKKSKWTEKQARIIVKKYQYLSDFVKKESSLYNWILRNNKSFLVKNLKRKQIPNKNNKNFKYSDEFLIDKAKMFKTKKDFLKKYKTYYNLINYRGIQGKAYLHMINH